MTTTVIQSQPEYSPALTSFLDRDRCLFVDGAWEASEGGSRIPVVDPSTGNQISWIVDASDADVDRAVQAARRAFDEGRWGGLPLAAREETVRNLADLIEQHADELAEIEAVDNGKPRTLARAVDLPATVAQFRYAAGWTTKVHGEHLKPALLPPDAFHSYSVREPVGVVGLIIPWNFPLIMAALKLGPALAAGCTVVLKPAEQTSLSALRLGELIIEAGIPAGVVNIVTGRGESAGAALARHPEIDKISFTGSTSVGREVMRVAADTMKRLTLELGGKSPMIMLDDVDPDLAIRGAAEAVVFNSGQICVAGTRLYAHRDIYDTVLDGVAAATSSLNLGPSLSPLSELGPVVSDAQQQRVMGYIESARNEGATVYSGGEQIDDRGYYVSPTIIADVDRDMRVMREEIFGPVLCVSRFDDLDEVAREANASDYGLAASVWTRDVSAMHKLAAKLRAGSVWGNCHSVLDPVLPVGGYKQSGFGREWGLEGVLEYTEIKTITVAL